MKVPAYNPSPPFDLKASRMRGSTIIPWLFFGPLLVTIVSKVVYDITGWAWAAVVAQVALAVVILVMLTAFAVHFHRSIKRSRKEQ